MKKPLLAATLTAVVFTACHGGSGGIVPAVPPNLSNRAPAVAGEGGGAASNATFSLTVPAGAVSPLGLRGIVYSQWLGNGPLVAQFVANVGPASPLCKKTGTARTCTIPATIPQGGPYEVVLSLYNKAPVGSTFPGAKYLGGAMLVATIRAGAANHVTMTTATLLARTSIALAAVPVHIIDPAKLAAIATGYDASGNAIVGTKYTGSKGSASIGIVADGVSKPAFTIAPAVVSNPASSGIFVSYSSAKVPANLIPTGFVATFTAATNAAGAKAGTAKLNLPAPHFIETALPGSNPYPYSIVAGPDGAMWFGEFNVGKVGRITTAMKLTNFYAGFDHPQSIVVGPDKALWIANDGGAGITQIAMPGTVHSHPLPANTYAVGISNGPHQYLWFASTFFNYVSWITTAGTLGPHYKLPKGGSSGSVPVTSVQAPDGNLYFVLNDNGLGSIAQITPSGTIPHNWAYSGAQRSPENIILGPDKNLWFTDTAQSAIFKLTTAGAFTKYRVPAAIGPSGPLAIGPDGKIWFTGGNTNVSRFDPLTGGIVTVALPSGSYGANGIGLGPDGALYLTEDMNPTAKIARLQ